MAGLLCALTYPNPECLVTQIFIEQIFVYGSSLSSERRWLVYGRLYLAQETWTELQVQCPKTGDETA